MKVVEFGSQNKEEALRIADALREAVEKGEVTAFIAVGITDEDATISWTAATKRVSRLRVTGALTHLTHCYINGDIG